MSRYKYAQGRNLVRKALNPNQRSPQEIERDISDNSGFIKMTCGVANNCAYGIMMDCLDQLRKHPGYSRRAKRLFEGKSYGVTEIYRAYRNRLRWPGRSDVHYFDLKFMPEEARRKYHITSDDQYFEFWEATGAFSYNKSRKWVTSLWNKFRLSMINHHVPNADIAAWGLVGASVLELAVETWRLATRAVREVVPELPQSFYEMIYRPFSLQPVSVAWQKAFIALCPESGTYKLDSTEERNIAMGLLQLRDLWISPDMPYDAVIRAMEDYADEIFRTKGDAREAISKMAEMRDEAVREVNQERQKNKCNFLDNGNYDK